MNIFLYVIILSISTPLFSQTKPDALVEYRNGNYEEAIAICKIELQENASNVDSHIVMCWSLIKLSRYSEAREYARTVRSISRYDPRVSEILGEINFYEGRNREALQYFQEYLNLSTEGPRTESVYYFLGELYIRQGHFRQADIALSLAVHWQPQNTLWLTRLAYAQEKAGDYQVAAVTYQRALALDSRFQDALRGLERTRQAMKIR
ncbi:MAG: tetratricopeptide repeat protein [Spirochaetaceae bacterium]|jgi:tetratricopeptide (TPR) repeat protein|nr:tetratricopeptide repeat protein [Spirochaetaceae bacterium]